MNLAKRIAYLTGCAGLQAAMGAAAAQLHLEILDAVPRPAEETSGRATLDRGMVLIGLYSTPAGFPDPGRARFGARLPTSAPVRYSFTHIAPGTYAVAVFQDLNGNGELDRGLLGRPKEPYGFSNGARAGLFGPPSFDEASIRVGDDTRARVRLQR